MMALETASPTIVLISTISSTVGFKQTTKEAIHVLTKGSFSKVALKIMTFHLSYCASFKYSIISNNPLNSKTL